MSAPIFTRASRLLVGLAVLSAGCSFEADLQREPENGCTVTADCSGEDVCLTTTVIGRGVCVATEADLGNIILEVKPTDGGESSFVFLDAAEVSGSRPDGVVKSLELTLPETISVVGSVTGALDETPGCQASDQTIPVAVTLHRRFDSGPFRSSVSTLSSIVFTEESQSTAAFALDAPAGRYDAYLVPTVIEGCASAPPPPRLVPIEVLPGEGASLDVGHEDWTSLGGTLTVPSNVMVDGWILDLVDPLYGHVISDSFTLVTPPEGVSELAIGGELGIRYHNVDGAILRLRSATGELVVHWSVAALDLFSDGQVEVDLRDLVAEPESVEATVIDLNQKILPNAQVILQSLSLTGTANQNASFRVTTVSDEAGVVRVSLVPGTYAVSIVPTSDGVASFAGEWEISSGMGGSGKGFELPMQTRVVGNVSNTEGTELSSAPLRFGPRPAGLAYFDQAFKVDGTVTRYASATTSTFGSFEALVDPGTVDVAVTMLATTGYPWLVLPSRVVPASGDVPTFDLGELEMPSPAVVQGIVKSSDGSSGLALALVYAYVKTSKEAEAPLIQIGASTTDVNGRFFLPLPPRITEP